MANILETHLVTKAFGSFVANHQVSLSVPDGERRVIIGPNGAGKSTLINMLGGQLRPTSGDVYLRGQKINRLAPTARARRGIARTYQITNLFAGMSVLDNVQVTLAAASSARWVFWKPLSQTRDLQARALRYLETWGLSTFADHDVASLSYGQQRLLEIVLSLCNSPNVLLLDEPTAGLAESDAKAVTELISELPRAITILMIEHDMEVAFRLADRVTVMCDGAILSEGDPDKVASDQAVQDAYLGGFARA